MKIILIIWAVIISLVVLGFFLQWVRWQFIPSIKDKIKEKKLKKNSKKL